MEFNEIENKNAIKEDQQNQELIIWKKKRQISGKINQGKKDTNK